MATDVYDYDSEQVTHPDIHSLDLEEGKWFKCRFCDNPRDTSGKFICRPSAAVEITGVSRGHMQNKSHKDNKEQQAPAAAATPVVALLQQSPSGQQQEPPQPAPPAEQVAVAVAAAVPADALHKAPIPCEGLGWEQAETQVPWQQYYSSYAYYVAGAAKASTKFAIDLHDGKFVAKATDCDNVGLKTWQHKVKCCTSCH